MKDTILHAVHKDKRSESDAQNSPAYANNLNGRFGLEKKRHVITLIEISIFCLLILVV